MNVLALELSTALGSVARLRDGSEIVREFSNDRKHSGEFFRNLQELCADETADVIAVGTGPGSYAGVRIAIATAIGLRCSSAGRVVGLPSICALAVREREYNVIGDARRQTYFFAKVVERRCIEGPDLHTDAELRQRLNSNRAVPVFSSQPLPQFPQVVVAYPSALELARLAATCDIPNEERPLEPIYLREPHITIPRTPSRAVAVNQ
jgi:tRNA threonylcarbamoyladenosine biosynthesis protein TsaB